MGLQEGSILVVDGEKRGMSRGVIFLEMNTMSRDI